VGKAHKTSIKRISPTSGGGSHFMFNFHFVLKSSCDVFCASNKKYVHKLFSSCAVLQKLGPLIICYIQPLSMHRAIYIELAESFILVPRIVARTSQQQLLVCSCPKVIICRLASVSRSFHLQIIKSGHAWQPEYTIGLRSGDNKMRK